MCEIRQVVYSLGGLTAQRYGQLFAVNSSTGDLHVRGQIDYEQSSVYYLTIVAADRGASRLGSGGGSGGQSSSASITVRYIFVVKFVCNRQCSFEDERPKVTRRSTCRCSLMITLCCVCREVRIFFIILFLSRVSTAMLTRDIDMAILSFCLFVTFRYCIERA